MPVARSARLTAYSHAKFIGAFCAVIQSDARCAARTRPPDAHGCRLPRSEEIRVKIRWEFFSALSRRVLLGVFVRSRFYYFYSFSRNRTRHVLCMQKIRARQRAARVFFFFFPVNPTRSSCER